MGFKKLINGILSEIKYFLTCFSYSMSDYPLISLFQCVCRFDRQGPLCELPIVIRNAAFSGDSYVSHRIYKDIGQHEALDAVLPMHIQLKVRTRATNGLIMLAAAQGTKGATTWPCSSRRDWCSSSSPAACRRCFWASWKHRSTRATKLPFELSKWKVSESTAECNYVWTCTGKNDLRISDGVFCF